MESQNEKQTWGTWEDLLLASAVKRHGINDWDSVSMELQSRTSLPHPLTTPRNCQQKFHDLRLRFGPHSEHDDHIPWLEDLRTLRVSELRQELKRYDVSILSLQLKLKILQEDRERDVTENDGNGDGRPDLKLPGENRSENDKKIEPEKEPEPENSEPGRFRGGNRKVSPGDESDRENQSVNESNSTGSRNENRKTTLEGVKLEPEEDRTGSYRPERNRKKETKPVGEESNNGTYDNGVKTPTKDDSLPPSHERKAEDPSELKDSEAHSRDGEGRARESSDVQSSASLTRKRKRRRRKEVSCGSSGEEQQENGEPSVKSHPLVGILDLINAHEHISLFGRRREIQESDKYRRLVRQHMDMETIRTKLQKGSYSSCTLALLRDLLLLFNNAIVFYPKNSLESSTAYQLRQLVSQEIKNQTQRTTKSDSLPPNQTQQHTKLEVSDSLLSKHISSGPILVCRKRSSISAKPKDDQQSDDKKPVIDAEIPIKSLDMAEEPSMVNSKPKENPTTGLRSLRRSTKKLTNTSNASKKPNSNSVSKGSLDRKLDASKADKSKAEDKKRSAADFLKRIKKNSTSEVLKGGNGSGGRGGVNSGKEQNKTMGSGGKGERGRERILRNSSVNKDKKNANANDSPSKRSVGRPPKKAAESASAKRGAESSGKDVGASKRPKKRSRR